MSVTGVPASPTQRLGLRAMLVTAGFGTRLAPLTDLLPKPAVPLANRPLAWFALDHLYRAGVRDLVLNTHHLAAELERELSPWVPSDLQLRFVFEPVLLGTAGGIRNAWQLRDDETFLVMNGKYLFAPDLQAALKLHVETDAIATMVLTDAPGTPGFGAVAIDPAGRVRSLRGQPADPDGMLRPMFYTGVSLLAARAFHDLPQQGCLVGDSYRHWVDRGERVLGFVDAGECRDAGMSHWHYWEANMALLSGAVHWPGIEPDPAGVLSDSNVSLGQDVKLARSALGRHAQVAAGVRVEDSIVWPGARVTSDAIRSIVLPDGRALAVPGAAPASR